MNAGKTHTAANLIRGLTKSGYRVGAAKVTGTSSGDDMWRMKDSGASSIMDFTDVGYSSTYMQTPRQNIRTTEFLVNSLALEGVDVIVMEVAHGLGQSETRVLLQDSSLKRLVDGVLFAADEAMSAAVGAKWLRQWGLPLVGISGKVTLSPLAIRELCTLENTPVVSSESLCSTEDLKYLLTDSLIRYSHHKGVIKPEIKIEENTADKPALRLNPTLSLQRAPTNSSVRDAQNPPDNFQIKTA